MILSKNQIKFIHDKFQNFLSKIKEKQDKEKDGWSYKEKTDLQRGTHVGKIAAYETIYHLARKELDNSYAQENYNSDNVLLRVSRDMEAQAKAIELLATELAQFNSEGINDLMNKFLDQAALLKANAELINKTVKEAESDWL